MDRSAGRTAPHLPAELRLRILSFLPPNELALSGRLSSKEAAQHFSEPHHGTATLTQPLPGYVAAGQGDDGTGAALRSTRAQGSMSDFVRCFEGAQLAMKQLTLQQKLHLLHTAAASGCEANVEFAWQLLQPHVFPELLQSEHYRGRFRCGWRALNSMPDAGSVAVASGLAHLLPSLAQRCPGLLHAGRTLEAAARHCDLAGLQAAWEAVEPHLQSSVRYDEAEMAARLGYPRTYEGATRMDYPAGVWRRVMAEAAVSPGPDALPKMEWVLSKGRGSSVPVEHAGVCGAAAATGDMSRLQWLRDKGFPWGTAATLAALLQDASLAFIERLEEEGGYLPAAGDAEAWGSPEVAIAAAASARDSTAKLQLLADRGAKLGRVDWARAVEAAAGQGNLEAVQQLVQCWRDGQAVPLPCEALFSALASAHRPTAAWLRQAGCGVYCNFLSRAAVQGDLEGFRWLLELGVTWDPDEGRSIHYWPSHSVSDSRRLVEAVQLLAARSPWREATQNGGLQQLLEYAAAAGHPWSVWRALRELLPAAAGDAGASGAAVRDGSVPGAEGEDGGVSGGAALDGGVSGAACSDAGDGGASGGAAGEGGVPGGAAGDGGASGGAAGNTSASGGAARDAGVCLVAACEAASAGCEATLEALVGMGMLERYGEGLAASWYISAAQNGDRGTLACLVRLGVPMGWGLLVEALKRGTALPGLRWLVEQGAPLDRTGVIDTLGALKGYYTEYVHPCNGWQVRHAVEDWFRAYLGLRPIRRHG